MPIADATACRRPLDLAQPRLEGHDRLQLDAFANCRDRRQAVDRQPGPREIEMRIVAQDQRRGIRDVDHRRSHPSRLERLDRLVEYTELSVSDRTLWIAGIGEQRAEAL